MENLLNYAIVGAIASIITQFLKKNFADGLPRAAFAIGISIVIGLIAYLVNMFPGVKEAMVGTIIFSNIVYQVIMKHLSIEE